jgi:hypothetical protein
MIPKMKLPDGAVELYRQGEFLLIEHTLNKDPYFTIFRFYETTKGTRYIARGGSNKDLDHVKNEFARITGKKLAPT